MHAMEEEARSTALVVVRPDRPARALHTSCHARNRMWSRSLSREAVEAALTYGRKGFTRGAENFAIGRTEVTYYASRGIDLKGFAGIQVVCSHDGQIITAYRNHDFSRWRKSKYYSGKNRHVP